MSFNQCLTWLLISGAVLSLSALPALAQDATDEPAMELPDMVIVERPGFTPEGIEWDAANGRFLLGSLVEGTVFEVADDGTITPFIEDERFTSTVGIEIDEANNRLLVTNSGADGFQGGPGGAALGAYDLTTGEEIYYVDLGALTPDGSNIANDVAVDEEGNAYVTNSVQPVIYKVDMEGNAEIFAQDDRLTNENFGLNGIEFHAHGYLIAALTGAGTLLKIPLDDPTNITTVEIDQPIGGDGIVIDPETGDLVVVDGSTGSVLRLQSDDEWATAAVTASSPDHAATTAAIRDGEVYVIYAHFEGMDGSVEVNQYEIVHVDFEDVM